MFSHFGVTTRNIKNPFSLEAYRMLTATNFVKCDGNAIITIKYVKLERGWVRYQKPVKQSKILSCLKTVALRECTAGISSLYTPFLREL